MPAPRRRGRRSQGGNLRPFLFPRPPSGCFFLLFESPTALDTRLCFAGETLLADGVFKFSSPLTRVAQLVEPRRGIFFR